MGKIFRISDTPISTIESALRPLTLDSPKCTIIKKTAMDETDKFIPRNKVAKSNPVVKMRNGFGKLMAHFSHPKTKA